MDIDDALAFSRYARRVLAAHPDWRDELDRTVDAPFAWTTPPGVDAAGAVDADDAAPRSRRRCARSRARLMLHTIARDLTGRAALDEVVRRR